MSDTPQPADPVIEPTREGITSRLSLVWLVPVAALLISLGVAWQNYASRGVLVQVTFENASGIEAGKTELKYRDVSVGLVQDVTFSEDLSQVIVSLRVDNTIAPYLDEGARFWVVRPQVSVRGVSGLGTVLSGVFIEGSWDSVIGASATEFVGADGPPTVRPGREGLLIVLRAREGHQLGNGAPILFKGVRVGAIETPRLTASGNAVVVNGFIEAPYDQLITSETRFWDSSGFEVSFGPGGLSLDVNSLASLVEGGVTFETLVSGGTPVEPGTMFPIFADESAAQDSLFDERATNALRLAAEFDGSVRGLQVGADVRFRGLRIGEVTALNMVIDETAGKEVRMRVSMSVRPGRLGLDPEASTADALALLQSYASQGMRARLDSAGLLGGSLMIDFAELPELGAAEIDVAAEPYPLIPSTEPAVSDFAATAEGVFERLNALPVEDLLNNAIDVLASANTVLASEGVQSLPAELAATLEDARGILSEIAEAGAPAKLNAALGSAEAAANAVAEAAGRLPALAAKLETAANRLETVLAAYGDKSRLVNTAVDALRSINETSESIKALARTLQRNPNSLILGR
ncbi:MAG: MlaD family protein [Pseudomonadota bacterium]